MKSKLLLAVFAALLLVGCTNNQESGLLTNNHKELSSTKTLRVPLMQYEEIDEIVEKDEEEINNSFSSDSKMQYSSSNKTNEDRKTQNDHGTKEEEDNTPKDDFKPSADVPTPEPEQPVPAPVPDPTPDPTPVPKDEPKKQFILPSNWTNGDEHNEYYLSLDEAVARVNELWSQRIDAGYSQLYDAETDTTYTWVTWWE